ncbi:uncharacterized protein [Haliotis asinina]|uniref:uncharacterized protein n=1 Tax=Haliotis asinina TaxID=109174 RepID=UPI003531D835
MSMSGIQMSPECELAHARQLSKEKDVQWTLYRIDQSPGKTPEIIVDCQVSRRFCATTANAQQAEDVEKTNKQLWLDFIECLPENESRYAVFDYVQPTQSGIFKDAIRFVAWSPDNGPVKNKMIYSSTKDTFKKKLNLQKDEVFISSKCPDDIEDCYKKLAAI